MAESLLDAIVVVLYEPQNPINIAATVRAMKNMGIGRLRLVRPVEYEPVNLEGIAHGTMDVIERIEHFDSFDTAVAECVVALLEVGGTGDAWTALPNRPPVRIRFPELRGRGFRHSATPERKAATDRSESGRG